jgi:hypothetical protein
MPEKCPVCNTVIQKPEAAFVNERKLESFSCRRCGDFTLDWTVLRPDVLQDTILKDDIIKRAALSHWIRLEHESRIKQPADDQYRREATFLNRSLVESIIKNPHPSPMDQADRLVRWAGDNSRAGEVITVDKCTIEAIVGSADSAEFSLVFDYLFKDEGIITGELRFGGTGAIRPADIRVGLSFSGWKHYQELKRATSDSRKAFMAMQYNKKPLESIVETVFRGAVRQTGFDLFLLRERPVAGLIDNRLRAEIRAARFLIADLTHRNPGAYWEAGYAEGLGKPVIYTCEKRTFGNSKRTPHFNTNHHQTVLWDSRKPEDTAKELKATIRATLPGEAKATDD